MSKEYQYTVMLYAPDKDGTPTDKDNREDAVKWNVWVRRDTVPMIPNGFDEVEVHDKDFPIDDTGFDAPYEDALAYTATLIEQHYAGAYLDEY